jgi:hypothetical protein
MKSKRRHKRTSSLAPLTSLIHLHLLTVNAAIPTPHPQPKSRDPHLSPLPQKTRARNNNNTPPHPSTQRPENMASNKQSDDKSTPLQPKKPKLQRRPLTTQTGSAPLGAPDEDPPPMCLRTFLNPLSTGFELSEKTTNTNRFLEAIEQGLRPKTATEMEREGKGVSGLQKPAQKSTTPYTTRA